MPPGGVIELGKPFCEISLSNVYIYICIFLSPILNIVTVNDRYKDSPEGFFPRFTSQRFRTNFVEKMEYVT